MVGRELYDHETDPMENKNLAVDPGRASLIKRLEEQLQLGWKSALPE